MKYFIPLLLALCLLPSCVFAAPADANAAFDRQDYGTALKIWRQEADAGAPRAQYNLGLLYLNGFGVETDDAAAAAWFGKAAAQGYAAAEIELGRLCHEGRGMPIDDEAALNWWRKAADRGNPEGQEFVGMSYFYGWGVKRDAAATVAWFRLAAAQGDEFAQEKLGLMYHDGEDVAQDEVQAYFWFSLAEEFGSPALWTRALRMFDKLSLGAERLGSVEKNIEAWKLDPARTQAGWGAYLRGDYMQALKLWGPPAAKGNAGAEEGLGTMYMLGLGVAQDGAAALSLFERAAAQENIDAEDRLAEMYDTGNYGVKQDYTTAVKWYRKAAGQGGGFSQLRLGELYEQGLGTKQDYAEAYFWKSLFGEAGRLLGAPITGDALLGSAEAHLTPTQISATQARVRAWLRDHPIPVEAPAAASPPAKLEKQP